MRWIKMILAGLAGIILFAFLFSLFFSPVGHVERAGAIAAKPSVVFNQIADLHKMVQWIPWGQTDSSLQLAFSDTATGVNSWYSWHSTSKSIPPGEFRITNIIPDKRVDYVMHLKGIPVSTGSFILQPTTDGKNTWIKWTLNTQVGWTPWWKFYGLMMDKLVGPGMEQGLTHLKNICEKDTSYNLQ
jgi:Polyketide cyclase / dehydrase and lipid transport